jgi:alpha-tubulin suppressor-like RCC1 family protein/serine/threonine protein kinase
VTSDLEVHELARLAELESEYEIVRELGRGGTAIVYLARDRELGRHVAIKVIRASYIEDEEAAARLTREAQTVASLQHPNIVVLYGTRRLRGKDLALIMQYIPGRTLKSEVVSCGPLPFDRVEQILTDVGRALSCAQRQRILHRDIKPENIYIDEETGSARLSDFGIARPLEAGQNLTLPGMALGTPAYMSPEQFDGRDLDGRTDLYSLGLVGYEMLTGRPPWSGESLFSIMYRQTHESLPELETLRPGIPDRLRIALEGMLRKDREERWRDAEEFLAVLRGEVVAPKRWPAVHSGLRTETIATAESESETIPFRRDDLTSVDTHALFARANSRGHEPTPDVVAPARQDAALSTTERNLLTRVSELVARAAEFAGPPRAIDDGPTVLVKRFPWLPLGRTIAIAATLPLILVSAGLVLLVNERDGNDGSVRGTTPAAGNAEPVAHAPVQSVSAPDLRPRLARVVQGDRQSGGLAGDTLREPLVLRVENEAGHPVAGVTVRFEITSGEGEVDPEDAVTDTAGAVRARWLLRTPGAHVLAARVPGLTDATTFHAEALPRPPARIVALSPVEFTATSGTSPESSLIVKVTDDRGDPVEGARVQFTVQNGQGRASLATSLTIQDGTAHAEWQPVAGNQVVATVAGLSVKGVVFRASSPTRLPIRSGMTVGGTHTCALDNDGAATCWGGNNDGQLGDGSVIRRSRPVAVVAQEPFASLSAGFSHTCGVTVSRVAYCWGSNADGQLGDGTRVDRAQPTRLSSDVRLASVFAGVSHSCGLDVEGRMYCWGENANGQLGDGTRTDSTQPVRVAGGYTFRSVALGWAHTCALRSDRTALCWGRNEAGELGDGGNRGRTSPAPVSGSARFTSIAAGSGHTCALTVDDTVWCWGQNSYGQLGNNASKNSTVPVIVQPINSFAAVALGSMHSCALTNEGTARCWGRNTYGQLGDGTIEDHWQPTPVAGGYRFNALRAGVAHTCGVVGSTRLCWGFNFDGQLGDGTRFNRTRPEIRR